MDTQQHISNLEVTEIFDDFELDGVQERVDEYSRILKERPSEHALYAVISDVVTGNSTEIVKESIVVVILERLFGRLFKETQTDVEDSGS